jgi:hypothetical protein
MNQPDKPLAVSFGGGANSTALLVELFRRGIRPDFILFADTGGERPETYLALDLVSAWCVASGFPEIQIVKASGKTLEQDCLDRRALPSIAYGPKTCSLRWKVEPQRRRLKALGLAEWTQAIGYDAGEPWRARLSDEPRATNWFPLIDWGIDRDECRKICVAAGLPFKKSACFFCPSSKKWEVVQLAKLHPDLAQRAVAMERGAELLWLKGLGRRWSWNALLQNEDQQTRLFETDGEPEVPCGCLD